MACNMKDRPFSRPWLRARFFGLLGRLRHGTAARWTPIDWQPERILVLLPVLRGDYLVASSLLTNLRRLYPKSRIAVMTTRVSHDLALADPHVDDVLIYHKLPKWPLSLLKIVRYKPDVLLLPKGHPATTESIVLLLTSARARVGLAHDHHNALLSHAVAHDWEHEHRTVAFSRLLAAFGLDPSTTGRRLHIGTTAEIELWAEDAREQLPAGTPLVALNPSASRESRRWTESAWGELIEALFVLRPEASVLVVGAPAEAELCQRLAERHPRVETLPTPSFLHASALIARCDLLITVDTGIVQAAAARGIPMVVLYNGDHEVYLRFAPQSVPHRAVLAPRGENVSAIGSEEVNRALVHLLDELERS